MKLPASSPSLAGVLLLLAAPLASQERPDLWVAATASAIEAHTTIAAGRTTATGITFGGEGGITWRFVSLRLGYVQGSLERDGSAGTAGPIWIGIGPQPDGPPANRDLVEAHALVGVRPVDVLEIATGIHARSYTAEEASERWLYWQLRGRFEAPVVGSLIHAFVEASTALTGTVDPGDSAFGGARGGAAGILLRLADGRFALRLAYSIDEAHRTGTTHRETLEGITLSAGFGPR